MASSYLVKNIPLTTDEAPPNNQCVTAAPLNVRGGEVYVYKPDAAEKEGRAIL